jgi:hypothetical protein
MIACWPRQLSSRTDKPNLQYTKWVTRDQALLSYILASLSRDVLMSVATHTTLAEVWGALAGMFGACTRAQTVNTHISMATTKKGATTMAEYYTKMKNLTDEMAASGQSLGDEEFMAYVLIGLDEELYNSLVSSIVTRVEPISSYELFSQMLSYELSLEKQPGRGYSSHSSANTAMRGHGGSFGRSGSNNTGYGRGRSCGSGQGTGPFPSRGGYTNTNVLHPTTSSDSSGGQTQPKCQVCWKIRHTTNVCWYRFNDEFIPDPHFAGGASSSGNANPNWYLDFDTTDHITGELEKLTMHDRYTGNDQIHAANDAGMEIVYVGKSVLPTSTRSLHLENVLHVPHAHKNLVSIHRFNIDNNTFVELHPFFFLIKGQVTRKILLCGPCKGGLYPLTALPSPTQKLLLSVVKPSSSR